MRVFVAGGSGLIGSRLVRALHERQDSVLLLTRRPDTVRQSLGSACTVVTGDPSKEGPWMAAVDHCDAVINLTGENIFNRRWNAAFKEQLRDSRLLSTRNLVQALARKPRNAAGQPRALVNASAIGWYGPCGDEELTEDSPPGQDFLARLCVDWEEAARQGEKHELRVAMVRVGVVLAKEAGALKQMLTPFKLAVGGRTGSGKQWLSWVHHADVVGIFLAALDRADARGPVNGVAPNPVRNQDFATALGLALHRPTFLPTPGFALKMGLGEVADVLLTGQRVLPRKAQALGYTYRFPNLDDALRDLLAH